MNIDEKLVEHVATLARLKIKPDELNLYREQLENIVGYIDQIKSFQLTQQENPSPSLKEVLDPMVGVEDEVIDNANVDKAMEQAPERTGSSFVVPKVIEG